MAAVARRNYPPQRTAASARGRAYLAKMAESRRPVPSVNSPARSTPSPRLPVPDVQRLSDDEDKELKALDEMVKMRRNSYNADVKAQNRFRALLAKQAGVPDEEP